MSQIIPLLPLGRAARLEWDSIQGKPLGLNEYMVLFLQTHPETARHFQPFGVKPFEFAVVFPYFVWADQNGLPLRSFPKDIAGDHIFWTSPQAFQTFKNMISFTNFDTIFFSASIKKHSEFIVKNMKLRVHYWLVYYIHNQKNNLGIPVVVNDALPLGKVFVKSEPYKHS